MLSGSATVAAQSSTVEIVVRTHEMKLRLRGTVQASHPATGWCGIRVEDEGRTGQCEQVD